MKYPDHGTFLSQKERGVPQAIFEKYHGTFLVIIMLKFASNIKVYCQKINETK